MKKKREALWFIYRYGRSGRYLPAYGYIIADATTLPPLDYKHYKNLAEDIVWQWEAK